MATGIRFRARAATLALFLGMAAVMTVQPLQAGAAQKEVQKKGAVGSAYRLMPGGKALPGKTTGKARPHPGAKAAPGGKRATKPGPGATRKAPMPPMPGHGRASGGYNPDFSPRKGGAVSGPKAPGQPRTATPGRPVGSAVQRGLQGGKGKAGPGAKPGGGGRGMPWREYNRSRGRGPVYPPEYWRSRPNNDRAQRTVPPVPMPDPAQNMPETPPGFGRDRGFRGDPGMGAPQPGFGRGGNRNDWVRGFTSRLQGEKTPQSGTGGRKPKFIGPPSNSANTVQPMGGSKGDKGPGQWKGGGVKRGNPAHSPNSVTPMGGGQGAKTPLKTSEKSNTKGPLKTPAKSGSKGFAQGSNSKSSTQKDEQARQSTQKDRKQNTGPDNPPKKDTSSDNQPKDDKGSAGGSDTKDSDTKDSDTKKTQVDPNEPKSKAGMVGRDGSDQCSERTGGAGSCGGGQSSEEEAERKRQRLTGGGGATDGNPEGGEGGSDCGLRGGFAGCSSGSRGVGQATDPGHLGDQGIPAGDAAPAFNPDWAIDPAGGP